MKFAVDWMPAGGLMAGVCCLQRRPSSVIGVQACADFSVLV